MEVNEPSAKYLAQAGTHQTEAGTLPIDWCAVALSELLHSKQLGGNYKNGALETIWPLIKMGNLGRGKIDCAKVEFVHPSAPPLARDRLHADDVLFNTRNTLELVGKVAIWRDELPEAYFNSNIMRMVFDPTWVGSIAYMNYVLNTYRSIAALRAIATGTTSVAAIYSRDFTSVYLPLPSSKAEQKTIAEVLTDADALIDSLERMLTKKRQIKQGAMQELLTGKKRLPGFSGGWARAMLAEHGHCTRGVAYKPDEDLADGDTARTVRLFRANNVHGGRIAPDDIQFVDRSRVKESQLLKQGDVLICMANGSKDLVGKAGCFNLQDGKRYTFGAFMAAFRAASAVVHSSFLNVLFQTHAYREHIALLLAGSSINNLTPSGLLSFRFLHPRDTIEQRAIAQVLCDLDAEIADVEANLAKARDIKQGMMQALLTGRIRLVQPA